MEGGPWGSLGVFWGGSEGVLGVFGGCEGFWGSALFCGAVWRPPAALMGRVSPLPPPGPPPPPHFRPLSAAGAAGSGRFLHDRKC